ncbi:MAG: rod shape-determining protein MreD [Chloroflexota bacterium]
MSNSIYVAIPLMALLAIAQTAILPRVPVLGMVPQLLFLVALAWGLLRGLEQGLLWAFIAGIFVDLFSLTPIGLSSLAYMLAVTPAILLQGVLPPRRYLVAGLAAILATIIYLLVYFIALRFFDLGMSIDTLLEMLPVALLHGILIVPIYALMQAILNLLQPRRVEL